jgi:hypothetical protein
MARALVATTLVRGPPRRSARQRRRRRDGRPSREPPELSSRKPRPRRCASSRRPRRNHGSSTGSILVRRARRALDPGARSAGGALRPPNRPRLLRRDRDTRRSRAPRLIDGREMQYAPNAVCSRDATDGDPVGRGEQCAAQRGGQCPRTRCITRRRKYCSSHQQPGARRSPRSSPSPTSLNHRHVAVHPTRPSVAEARPAPA